MITKPTVLILGAGASIPYGYPSGSRLVQDLYGYMGNSGWIIPLLQSGVTENEIARFRNELYLSQQPSVDAFLEQRVEYVRIGKLSIALELLYLEDQDMLFKFETRNKGCYHYLFNQLNAGWDKFGENKLSIITFNYDRSLEHFLYTALKYTYNKPDNSTCEMIQKIPIIHVHGWLGPLEWQESGGRPYMKPFNDIPQSSISAAQLQFAAEQILVLSEGKKATSEYNKAFDYLKDAQRIYFLGFGYHPQNMERLRLHELNCADDLLSNPGIFLDPRHIRPIRYRGSAYGLGKAQIETLQNQWHIGLPDETCDSLEFLKEYTLLD